MNVTVPLAVPAAGAYRLTVAVNVTDWPNTDGFVDETSVVVVSPSVDHLIDRARTYCH